MARINVYECLKCFILLRGDEQLPNRLLPLCGVFVVAMRRP